MSPQTKRFFFWFVILFFIIFIILVSNSLIHNFNKSKIISLPAREMRGVWMSRFNYTEPFPSHNPDSMKTYISDSFRQFKDANFNVIFFQVRGNADAFYSSRYEPWSDLLTGKLGQNPGWDPLAYAIEIAHQLGLELHAWINVFPAWRGTVPPTVSQPLHPYRTHPEWLICDRDGKKMPLSNDYVSFSPGIPAVHNHIIKVISDIVSRYDIDGIHFDYLRYPERSEIKGYSHDPISCARFQSHPGNPLGLGWEDWQREQITEFVARAYNCITDLKPEIKVSAAVIGSYKSNKWNGYSAGFQDVRRWAEIGKIDLIIPMTYYPFNHKGFTFNKALKEWQSVIDNTEQIFPALAAFNLSWEEIIEEIHLIRNSNFKGMVFFAASSLDNDKLRYLQTTVFKYPAIFPSLTWKDAVAPLSPINFAVKRVKSDSLEFTWQIPDQIGDINTCKKFVIYRSQTLPIDLSRGENILAIVGGSDSSYTTKLIPHDQRRYHFTITSLDAAYNQSAPAPVIKIK
ncbi:MAG TPA: family 10 glycosylhydrolase [Candidatus Marinimicrobia bacterium]|nr:family 10 glycosylhydrolase [Candidatus Neomarinimicrobiota bacterium]HRS51588.1 family 10 glycosylhydrolase [Candidatus Neomarinimicrobiota bacterium]HRU92334.1 family 10 glycosylhydrolase [Candidatus Neomarinimicrobiota bacterium]